MLNKNDVLSLRDFALAHLPKVVVKRDEAAVTGRTNAERAVAWSHDLTMYSPASTAIELQAARLLKCVGTHPETHIERLIPNCPQDDGALAITVEDAVKWAEQDREFTEGLLLELTRELSRLSGSPLPSWMSGLDVDSIEPPQPPKIDPTAEKRTAHDVRSERGARRLILDQWENIRLLHPAGADGRQVLRIILRTLPKDANKPELKTIQNKLATLRMEGLIP